MPDQVSPTGHHLSREERVLATVVQDLGLASAEQAIAAVAEVVARRAGDERVALATVLRERGVLTRDVEEVVTKAVRAILDAEEPPAAGAAQASPSGGRIADRGASDEREPADGGIYRHVPKGEGYSVRSKEDVAAAWAAYKRGEPLPDAAPAGPDAGTTEDRDAVPPAEASPGADAASGEAPAVEGEGAPAEGAEGASGYLGARRLTPVPRTTPLPRGTPVPRRSPLPRRLKYVPKGRQGDTEDDLDADAESLRAELGIGKKAGPAGSEATPKVEAVPRDPKQKAIALRAFVRRVVPSMLHSVCLRAIVRGRMGTISASRLATEAGCDERDSARVLEDWTAAGLAKIAHHRHRLYQLALSAADVALAKEYLSLQSNPEWHQRFLGWIVEEGG